MLIGIDGNEANIKNRVGVNVYAFELLWNLYKLQDEWGSRHEVVVYLRSNPQEDLPEESKYWHYEVLTSSRPFWILTRLMPYLWTTKQKPAVLFSPSHYTMPFLSIPRVCSIMDLGYLEYSGQFKKTVFWQLKYWSAISIFVSKRIIAISKATAVDIVRRYPFASRKVDVTLLSYNKQKYNTNISTIDVRRIKEKYSIVDDYILYIGTLKPSKNVENILRAYATIKQNRKIKLVIAGKKGWMFEQIFKLVSDLKIDSRVIFTDYLPEEDKPGLIIGARLLISPSLTEGFGLHVLEAMACGVPVVVSRAGSLPEIVDEAGIYVDPTDVSDIASGIEIVLALPEKGYNDLREKGLAQASKFSWEKTARETLKVIEKAYA